MAARKKPAKRAKPKVWLVARTRCNGTMTEAQYFGWIRSQLRAASLKWKPIYEKRSEGRRAPFPEERKVWGNLIKWVNQCEKCTQWFPNKHLAVDHSPAVGSLGTTEEEFKVMAGPAILRMFSEGAHLRLLCHECHHEVTHGEDSAA